MALTLTAEKRLNTNNDLRSLAARNVAFEMGTIAFDSSYPAGGETFTPSNLRVILGAIIQPYGGYKFQYIATASTYGTIVVEYADGNEVTNTLDLSGLSAVPYIAYGFA